MSEKHDHNHEEEQNFITIVNEEGVEEQFEILFNFDSEEFEKSYVLYFPAGAGEDEEIEILASSYIQDEDGKEGQLMPVETDDEWDMIEEILATFLADEDEE
ncbi:hypothetical protein X560_0650 [Listeria fleischmannii 1991]|uniref:UPF0473 protein NCTC13940_02618 n=2 Tax=Listeria fleischmannii TaxID=1069827 RepID=A0A2X3HH12_9LIST|nr:DUF1292 domain-containing protein [Listeria fleischmannii]EMG28559.1 hypothetical protein LFLEISCH_04800 [Listeria fleischmannii subsp. fleischmannii LU2006-1]KMT60522.1 hypothetical protein X560_0650 [Listeria fleischmannii 1991]SQC71907.1 Uncharacterized protein conserved in bacteria [Listeria fleischmannii subsp. fleischmannii]